MLIALAVCLFWLNRDITWRWKEDTLLVDGSQILIERIEVREIKSGGDPFRGTLRGTKITKIVIPDTAGEIVWESELLPMILERGDPPSKWMVIAGPLSCKDHYKYGSPRPPYIQFDLVDGQWLHKPVLQKWYGAHSNLLISEEQKSIHDGQLVTVEKIKKFNSPVYKIWPSDLIVESQKKSNCDR